MALNKASLANRVNSELVAQGFTPNNSPWIFKFCTAIANAVIDEITTNSELQATSVDGQGGITTGKVK